jgi:hypothetical protein
MLCAGGPDEKGDIASCLGETCSEVAADGAGTNDKDLHSILMLAFALWVRRASCWSRSGGGWSGLSRRGGIDAGAHQEKEIDEQDCDEDEAADEDVGPEAHDRFVARKVWRRDMFVLVVAFVVVFGHADKLTSQTRGRAH